MSELEGNWVRQNRVALGLTMAEVAAYAGISVAHLSMVETNRTRPSVPVLYHLAIQLGEESVAAAMEPWVPDAPRTVPAAQNETLF